jgi:hypothetical protein
MTAPIGPAHTLANNIGTALVNLGEKDFTLVWDAIQVRNNLSIIQHGGVWSSLSGRAISLDDVTGAIDFNLALH